MPTLTLPQYLLYAASALAVTSVLGHTQMAFDVVFPSLNRSAPTAAATTPAAKTTTAAASPQAKSRHDDGLVAAGIGWMEGNQVFAVLAILYAKWAKFGITDSFDRAILVLTVGYQFACGVAFARRGIYKPLVALWLGPGLATLSQLV